MSVVHIKNSNEIVAKNIIRIMKIKGLKQRVVANKSGYDEKSFSAMLNGRKLIRATDIIPIANALDVDANDLFAT